jgi:SAM-dependent methyltransferase
VSTTDISSLTRQVLAFCGPGKVLDIGFAPGDVSREVRLFGFHGQSFDIGSLVGASIGDGSPPLQLPFAADAFDTVVASNFLERLNEEQIAPALRELRRVAHRFMLLRVPTIQQPDGQESLPSAGSRAWWEAACFAAGWRKHPRYYVASDYASLQQDAPWIVIPLEKIPDGALQTYPLERLREERDLHMDMLRESGSRSDAHVFRYQLAARFVRPGDVVLDAACGLGYGSHLIWTGTKASKVIGIDGSEYAAKYASSNFGYADEGLEFREGFLPQCLHSIPDNSVDLVVSFETLEHVEDPEGLLAEFDRVLAPGGRFIGSVPNDWSDETGEDPNPFHLHVYTLEKFRQQLRARFAVEKFFSQTADRVKKLSAKCEWVRRPRSLVELDNADAEPIEAEWWLCVAMKSPFAGASVPYAERHFSEAEQRAAGHALAFGRDYDNPWLVRAMVSIGLRTESPDLQVQWAQEVLASSAPDSADRGAALAILAYRLLDKQPAGDADQLCAEIQKYVSIPPRNPNARRWVISLNYVLALLHLEMGRRSEAAAALAAVLRDDPAEYSVTLVTKAVDAAWLLGSMHLADGKPQLAREIWRSEGLRWMRAVGKHMTSVSEQYDPPTFEPREMASVVRKIGRLLAAGKFADLAQSHPSVYQAEIEEEAFATQARINAMAEERKRMSAEIKELRAYLDAVLDGKAWLEENRARTMTYVEQLETSLRDRDAEVERLHAEIQALVDSKKWLEENRLSTMTYVEKLEASLRESAEDSVPPPLAEPQPQKSPSDDK